MAKEHAAMSRQPSCAGKYGAKALWSSALLSRSTMYPEGMVVRLRRLLAGLGMCAVLTSAVFPATHATNAHAENSSRTLSSSAQAAPPTKNSTSDTQNSSQLVVIGTSGLLWDWVTPETAPHLYAWATGDSTKLDSDEAGAPSSNVAAEQETASTESAGSSEKPTNAGALANMVVRAAGETTCPAEGWLTIGAGQRAQDVENCRILHAPTDGKIGDWQSFLDANRSNLYAAHLGTLGDALEGTSALAIGPGAALALAHSDGTLTAEYVDVPPLPGSTAQQNSSIPAQPPAETDDSNESARSVTTNDEGRTSAALGYREKAVGRELVVVDLGSVRYPNAQLSEAGDVPHGAHPSTFDRLKSAFSGVAEAPDQVRAQVAALDARFAELIAEVDSDATVMVASVGDAQSDAPELSFFAMRGPATTPGFATSSATRQPGLVQLFDVTATILGHTVPDSSVFAAALGAPVETGAISTPGEGVAQRLVDDQRRSQAVRPLIGPFYLSLGVLLILVVGLAFAVWRRPAQDPAEPTQNLAEAESTSSTSGSTPPGRMRLTRSNPRRSLRQLAAWVAAIPVSSFLVNVLPWWRFDNPGVGLFSGIALIAALIAAVALIAARQHRDAPYLVIGGISSLVLIGDVLLDTHLPSYSLQLASLLGSQPQVGGRFYGFSNAPFAILTAGLLLMAAALACRVREQFGRMWALVVVAVIGVIGTVVDGASTLGADFGGPPALIVGFVILGLLVVGVRVTAWRVGAVIGAAICAVLAFSFIDYLKPPTQRSHLGRFIQSVLDGGAGTIVTRKLTDLVFGLPWPLAALMIVAVLAVVATALWWIRRTWGRRGSAESIRQAWRDFPPLRTSVIAIAAALLVGVGINDSGVVILFIGAVVALPVWVISLTDDESARRLA
ncbi:hypothetical protein I6E29_07265 [Arcanobacterium haemolyticum]|nr:hypothetical protein [Arcanobacterium haemolyticum]